MRKPIIALLAAFMVGACGHSVIYVPATTPEPAAQPEPIQEAIPPVGVTVARVEGSRLLVSTNQPAYLAVFEIVPERGVALVYPVSPRQRQVAHTGASWLDVLSDPARARSGVWMVDRGLGHSVGSRTRATERYIYAIASYRPLRISNRAFDDSYLRDVLGPRAFRAADPYETMEALAKHFVPAQIDEDWGEDFLAMEIERPNTPTRVARVYCPDGSVTYVRDEYAERAICPLRGRGTGVSARPGRPDSIVASGGGPVVRRVGTRPPTPSPFRIRRPPVASPGQQNAGRPASGNPPAGKPAGGTGSANGDERERSNNGNHYGWENGNRGNGDNRNGDNRNGTGNGTGNSTGNSTGNGTGNSTGNGTGNSTGNGTGNNNGNQASNGSNGSNGNGTNAGSRGNGASNGSGSSSPIRSSIGKLTGRSGDAERDTSARVRQSGESVTRRPVPAAMRRQAPDSASPKPAAEEPAQPESAQPPAEAKPEPSPAEAKPRPTSRVPVTRRRSEPTAPDSTSDAPADSRGKRPTTP